MLIRSAVLNAVVHSKYVNVNYKVFKLTACKVQLNNRRCFSDSAYFHHVGKEPLLYRTFGEQLQISASKYSARPALISYHEGKRYSFAEIKQEAENLAVKLNELGMQRGDHLGIWITNNSQWYISYMAAALAGYTVVCINPAFQPQEIAYALRKARVKTLITMAECGKQNFYGILKEILSSASINGAGPIDDPQFPDLRYVVMQSEAPLSEFLSWDELRRNSALPSDINELNQKVEQISPEQVYNIQFTSGTTGLPKVALLSHFACVNQARIFGRIIQLQKTPKHLCLAVPLFHIFGLSVMFASFTYGSTLVLPNPRFDSIATLESISKEDCHIILGTPTMYVDMLEKQRRLQKPLPSLESGVVGGAACSPEVYYQTKKLLNLKHFLIGYGLSESCGACFFQTGADNDDEPAQTVGGIFEHLEAKVIDDQGKIVRFGEAGELCLRGYLIMTEYMDDVEKTKEVLDKHGWFKTGDKFSLDSNGVGRIVGRKKDIIIRGGENIFPKEIEDQLDAHEDIIESQVIGVPDQRMGEEVCAYLRLRPGAKQLALEEIKEFFKGKIAHFKVPRYIRFVEEYPKTASGKIKKFELLKLFENELKNGEDREGR
ncbi:medium-chain acyl-CoA ligase ACSF2, mitochondrial-like [Anastrepha obliqua]|uniref:medium-chain acyl-CoA ligase ACSF2, mitochondrial-like n=1 Tax=Anastrepha obliqua TaxID=95512 RepID=UPI0024099527|nr:medium-chain acyl-CoA ligase ACSF2, mitochondrial-like [Anastrepha obliqua]